MTFTGLHRDHSNVVSLDEMRGQHAAARLKQGPITVVATTESRHPARDTVFFVTGGQFKCMVNGAVGTLRSGDFVRVPEGAAYGFEDDGAMPGTKLSCRFPTPVEAGLLRELAVALPPFAQALPAAGTAAFERLAAIAHRWGYKLDSDAAA